MVALRLNFISSKAHLAKLQEIQRLCEVASAASNNISLYLDTF